MDLSRSFREMFQLQPAPSCFCVINSANSGVIDCVDGSVDCLLSQRLVTVKLGLADTVLHNFRLNSVFSCVCSM